VIWLPIVPQNPLKHNVIWLIQTVDERAVYRGRGLGSMCFGYQLFPKIFWKKTQHDLAYQLFNGWRKEGQCDLVSNYSPTSFPKITMWFGLPIMQTAGERGSWRKEGLDPSKELLFYSIDIVFKKFCKIYL
jgi:hypothetical protein